MTDLAPGSRRRLLVLEFVFERVLPRIRRMPRLEAWLIREGVKAQKELAEHE